jgi:hypothetical protein
MYSSLPAHRRVLWPSGHGVDAPPPEFTPFRYHGDAYFGPAYFGTLYWF